MEKQVFQTINGKDEQTFLKDYYHRIDSVSEIGLEWSDLVSMHDYYSGSVMGKLELAAQQVFLDLKTIPHAHTVSYRVKHPEHVVNKAIRKKIDEDRVVTRDNFLEEFDDFIGLRILHLFKEDWEPIFKKLSEKYTALETPVVYYRKGDDQGFLDVCKANGIEPKVKEAGYRSIHYVAEIPFIGGEKFKCEIQIRTIFEEAWSEIDHRVRYPDNTGNELLNRYLLMFNKLASSADEMGSFLMMMKGNIAQLEKERNELENVAKELRDEIANLEGENSKQSKKIEELRNRLSRSFLWDVPVMPEFSTNNPYDYIGQLHHPLKAIFSDPLSSIKGSLEDYLYTQEMEKLRKAFEGEDTFLKMPKIGGPISSSFLPVDKDNKE